ncbi:uncharacterized protein EI90DRAFT_3204913, partial [Cantharellus anzutake]|uniref:uncharacterized protein n=1 Tax=Cantharellus anzutake TaxID=1750568 RepID=UPI00190614E3
DGDHYRIVVPFIRKMNTLDANLQSFTNAVGQLGSSVAISSSADELRDCLQRLLRSFHSNAAHLFEGGEKELASIPKPRRPASRYHTRTIRSALVQVDSPATIPEQMASLAHSLTTFVGCLNQIPEFTDQAVNASTTLFHDNLMYWSSYQFKRSYIRQYLNDLATEIGEHCESMSHSLHVFVDIGEVIHFREQEPI